VNGEDAINQLARTLDSLDDHLKRSDDVVRRSVKYRLTLLHFHAVFAIYIGLQFTQVDKRTMTGAAWELINGVPGRQWTLGILLALGGVILGVATWRRRIIGEIVGLCFLLSWYLTITASFAGGLIWWELGWFPAGTARPTPYAHGVYGHLATIMLVHIGALVRMRRSRLKAAR
jgi:hypothetical protein